MIVTIILLVLCVVLSGIFSSTEIAMFSTSDIKLRHLVDMGNKRAKLLSDMKHDSHKLLITILIGNNIANIGGASLATSLAIQLFGSAGVGIATGVMTLIILVAGEISPKALATTKSEEIALSMTPVIRFLMKIFSPLVWVFDKLTVAIVPASEGMGPSITEEEVRGIVNMSEEQGSINEEEREMIQNIFKLDDTYAGDIMTPRPDVFAFADDTMSNTVIKDVQERGYSRIPLYDGDLDNITGILNVKDLLNITAPVPLKRIARELLFVPETKRLDSLLREFKLKKIHLAIVVNEHGTMVGVVTIEDILEEIVGEIYDETDEEDDLESDIKHIKGSTYLMKGRAEIEDVNEVLNLHISDDDHSTLSGFIMKQMNRVPDANDSFVYKHYRFTVKKVENSRVALVYVNKVV